MKNIGMWRLIGLSFLLNQIWPLIPISLALKLPESVAMKGFWSDMGLQTWDVV